MLEFLELRVLTVSSMTTLVDISSDVISSEKPLRSTTERVSSSFYCVYYAWGNRQQLCQCCQCFLSSTIISIISRILCVNCQPYSTTEMLSKRKLTEFAVWSSDYPPICSWCRPVSFAETYRDQYQPHMVCTCLSSLAPPRSAGIVLSCMNQ